MIVLFVLVSFATFIGWQMLRSVVWFEIPARLANFLVPGIAYGLTWLVHPSILVALAATGGCALIHRFIAQDSIDPWTLRLPRRRKKLPKSRSLNPDKNRIPIL